MDWKRYCTAVIPCFNEAAHVGAVIAEVRRFLPSVIVVDDASTDATRQEAVRAGAEVVVQSTNGGKGAALRAGWKHARRLGFTWAMTMDGDGQHAASDIQAFLDCAERTRAPLIVGNRMENPAAMPWLRRRVNRWMSQRISAWTGRALPDSQCGFRLAHLDTLLELRLTANRFEIESEMLAALIAAGQEVEFVPVRVIYQNSASRINPVIDTWRWLRWLAAWRRTLIPGRINSCPTIGQERLTVAQVSKPAVSPTSKSAPRPNRRIRRFGNLRYSRLGSLRYRRSAAASSTP